jgi:hypothetical protein
LKRKWHDTLFSVLTILLENFPTLLKPYLPALLPPIWHTFTSGLALYESQVVRDEGGLEGVGGGGGEDAVGLESLVTEVLEFLRTMAGSRNIRKMVEPHLESIVYYAIGCIQI